MVVKLNPIILLNRQGSLGLWGHAPSGKYKYYSFFVLIASSSIKNFSQKVMIEALVLCTGWSSCIDTAL